MIKLSGEIEKIFESEVKGSFEKRKLWLKQTLDKYPNTWQLECWQGDCNMLDSFSEGDFITCYIDIKGNQWTNNNGTFVMNTLKCWNIEKDGKSFKEIKTP
jgi:hypothetical protein